MSTAKLVEQEVARNMGLTVRQFKQQKRRTMKEVLALMDGDALLGASGSPAFEEFWEARELMAKVVKKQSVKNWGR